MRKRSNGWLWFGSAVLALICTFVSYPGIWYSDSYVRVETGKAVAVAVFKTLTGHRFPLNTGNAFTVIPSFFMAASVALTGHVALYTYVQAFSFFAAVFLLIREMNPEGRIIQSVLFGLSPLVYGASVYYEANIGSLVGLIGLVLLFRRVKEEKSRKERIIEFLLITLASFVCFGYRTNALTVIPVFVIYQFALRKKWLERIVPLIAMVTGLVLVWAVPLAFDVRSESNGSTGPVWEILTAIQRMAPEDREQYLDYLDEIGGEGSTRIALQDSNENTVDGFMWGSGLNTTVLSAPGATAKVLGKYIQFIRERPAEWLGVKRDFVFKAMGVSAPLDLYEYAYNRWDRMEEYGMRDTPERRKFYQSFLDVNKAFEFFTCRPWVAFLISAVLVLIERIRKSRNRELNSLVFWLAVFYYGAYLIMICVFQQRMFYPSLLLLAVMDAAIVMGWMKELLLLVRRKRRMQPS